MSDKLLIKGTLEQMELIRDSLDLMASLGACQFDVLHYLVNYGDNANLDELNNLIEDSKRVGVNQGVGHSSLKSKNCYDMLAVLRHKIAWTKNPEGGMTVDFTPKTITYGNMVDLVVESFNEESTPALDTSMFNKFVSTSNDRDPENPGETEDEGFAIRLLNRLAAGENPDVIIKEYMSDGEDSVDQIELFQPIEMPKTFADHLKEKGNDI